VDGEMHLTPEIDAAFSVSLCPLQRDFRKCFGQQRSQQRFSPLQVEVYISPPQKWEKYDLSCMGFTRKTNNRRKQLPKGGREEKGCNRKDEAQHSRPLSLCDYLRDHRARELVSPQAFCLGFQVCLPQILQGFKILSGMPVADPARL